MTSFSGIDGLELTEVPEPTPSDGEEIVDVRAASLGPWDISAASGAFTAAGGSDELPQVAGWDFAGETAGGRRVLGFVAQPWMGVGALAERISVPSAILATLPDSLGFDVGSALPVGALTAKLLVDAAVKADDDLVLVTGAAGIVGGFTLQLARTRGARVVAAVRDSDAVEARHLGAEIVVDTDYQLEAEVRGHWEDGVDACIDTVGLGHDALVCVRDGGRFVTSVPTAVPDAHRDIAPETVQVAPDAGAAEELAGRAAAGELTVRVADVMPFERFREAFERLQRRGLRGKLVLTP